jgi:hypothetical protein
MKKLIRYLFLPDENNFYRAKLLHHDFLSLYLFVAFVFVLIFKFGPYSNILGFATDISVEKLYQLTNEVRVNNSLSLLIQNEKLSRAAEEKAKDMFANNYWSHYSPIGKTPWDFIITQDYKYDFAGENLAKNFLFSNNVIDAWMNSPTHRQNILRREFTEVGFAKVDGILNGEETTIIVQLFGKPQETTVLNSNISTKTLGESVAKTKSVKSVPNTVTKNKKIFDIKKISFNIVLSLILIISIALITDLYFGYKLKVIRVHGKNFAHLIFLLTIFSGLYFFLMNGVIL